MFVINDFRHEIIEKKVKMYINKDSTIKSDDSKFHTNFNRFKKEHIFRVIKMKQIGEIQH